MIQTKSDLKRYLDIEKKLYVSSIFPRYVIDALKGEFKYYRWKLIKYIRKLEYYNNKRKNNPLYNILYQLYLVKTHRLQLKLGIEINGDVFEEGLMIYHTQGIVVNGDSKVGKNCILHGANVIGNMGTDLKAPQIGDNVRLGVGAKVLGDVYIADDVQVGAGALVLHSCYEKGALLIGVPAHVYKK